MYRVVAPVWYSILASLHSRSVIPPILGQQNEVQSEVIPKRNWGWGLRTKLTVDTPQDLNAAMAWYRKAAEWVFGDK